MKKKDEIAAELKALGANFGNEEAATNLFHIPEGYFQHFPNEMAAVIKAMNAGTSFNLAMEKTGPFTVPDGYFEQLAQNVLLNIKVIENTATQPAPWQDIEKRIPYIIPEGYFEQFSQQLFDKIFRNEVVASEELEELSPLLATLKKEQPFSVPNGYFNGAAFARQVEEQQPQVKAIEHPAVRSIKWARWAAAAAVVFIFLLGGLHYFNPSAEMTTKPTFEQALAQIPDDRIEEWLSYHTEEADINNLGNGAANSKTKTIKASLNNFSEEEIKDYLEAEVW